MKTKLILLTIVLTIVAIFAGCSLIGIWPSSVDVSDVNTDGFPTISAGLEMRGLDDGYFTKLSADDFPEEVTEYVYYGTKDDIGDLIQSVTFPLDVTVNMTEETSNVDVVFVFDTTGSMGGEISGMVESANDFADQLDTSGVDFTIGCVTFGDTYGNTLDSYYERPYLAPTTEVSDFKDFMNSLTATGGGDGAENFIDAIDYARTSTSGDNPEGSFQTQAGFTYRSDAKTVFVGVTDIYYQTPASPGNVSSYYADGGPYSSAVYNTIEDEIAHLQDDAIVMHVVSPSYYQDYYTDLAYQTGGVWIDMDSDFEDVVDSIGTTISSNYIIRFTTTDETLGTYRSISFWVGGVYVTIEYEIDAYGARSAKVISIPSNSNY